MPEKKQPPEKPKLPQRNEPAPGGKKKPIPRFAQQVDFGMKSDDGEGFSAPIIRGPAMPIKKPLPKKQPPKQKR